jgi:hypothetical protein
LLSTQQKAAEIRTVKVTVTTTGIIRIYDNGQIQAQQAGTHQRIHTTERHHQVTLRAMRMIRKLAFLTLGARTTEARL